MATELPPAALPGGWNAQLPPSGYLPQDTKGGVVIGTAVTCILVASTAVSMRLYTRIFMVGGAGVDDWMALLSILCVIGLGINQIRNVETGLGSHIYTLNLPQALIDFTRDFWCSLLFFNITLFFVKMTFLFQYYRVVAQVPKLRFVYIASMVIVGGWSLAQVMVISFLCIPIEGFWNPSVAAKCLDTHAMLDMNAIGNIVTNFIVLILPLPVLLRLSLPPAQKWALVGVFSLGFLTCIISILRRMLGLMFTNDMTYTSVEIAAWSMAEATSGITCTVLPTLKPLLSRYLPSLKSRMQRLSGEQKAPEYQESTQASQKRSAVSRGGQSSREGSVSEPAEPWGHWNRHWPQIMRPPTPPPKDGSNEKKTATTQSRRETLWPKGTSTTIVGGEGAFSRPPSEAGGLTAPKHVAIKVRRDLRIESLHTN
ncbi:hypothetical protein F4775DRAFT_279081 [Biscogniauxia sp. FL1348]|nr:hypothetical protein F4775DRAFT_279081 [Biscogniauxia sp. FL1348]